MKKILSINFKSLQNNIRYKNCYKNNFSDSHHKISLIKYLQKTARRERKIKVVKLDYDFEV